MRKILLPALACFLSLSASAEYRLIRRNSLRELDNATIYSIVMDQTDAMWINSSRGLLRFNGTYIYKLQNPLPMHELHFDGENRIYALADSCILAFQTESLALSRLHLPVARSSHSVFCAGKEDLWFAEGAGLWRYAKGTESPVPALQLEEGQTIDALQLDASGQLWVAAGTSLFRWEEGKAQPVRQLASTASSLHFSEDGRLWIGYKQGGASVYDQQRRQIRDYAIQGSNFRTFCDSPDGIFIGSETELTLIDREGTIWSPHVGSPEHQPVTALARSRNGLLWAGTFYSGIFLLSGEQGALSNITFPAQLQNFRAVTRSAGDDLVFLTDGDGAWVYNTDGFQLIRQSEKLKFQSGLYLPEDGRIYAGLYQQGMTAMLPHQNYAFTTPALHISSKLGKLETRSINELRYRANRLWCATTSGVLSLARNGDGWEEDALHEEGKAFISLSFDAQGNLWAAGDGLYVLRTDNEDVLVRKGRYTAVCCDSNCVWAAEFGKGVWQIENRKAHLWNSDRCGLEDNAVTSITPISPTMVLLTTRSGISLLNPEKGTCRNLNKENGLVMSSGRNGSVVSMDDGRYLICGLDGAAIFDPSLLRPEISDRVPAVDFIHLQERDIHVIPGKRVSLPYRENNLRLEFGNFNYKEEANSGFEYSFSASGDDWHKANLSTPLSMVNLHPGKYVIRSRYPGGEEIQVFRFRIRPPWYASKPAFLLYFLLLIVSGWFVSRMLYSQLLLSQRLKEKEQENEKWKNLLLKLSHELRTPLSTISGNLEMFLEKYGKSQMGVPYLKKAWNGTAEMGNVLSKLLEIEDTDLIKFDDLPSYDTISPIQFIPKAHTLLLADDNPEVLAMLEDIFAEEYTLLQAHDGTEAFDMAVKSQPDLIISDVMMPGMDGLALCSALRAEYATRHIPIILLTAHAAERNLIEGLNAGADDYLAKPFSVEILRAKCRSLIRTREALKDRITPVPKQKTTPFLNAAVSAVERHLYDKELNVGTLCREMNVSKTTLNRKLEELAGMSPRDFIEDIKLKYAATMLLKENSRISEISDRLNFSSQKYFTLRFKKKFGKTPSAYIKGQD